MTLSTSLLDLPRGGTLMRVSGDPISVYSVKYLHTPYNLRFIKASRPELQMSSTIKPAVL